MNLKKHLDNLDPNTAVWLMLGLWWAVNLIQAAFTGLADDEAYYHMFSRHLAWGYFDHPPLTALFVRMGSFIGGELGVRFFFTLLQPLYLYILWVIVKPEKYTSRDAGRFVLISAALPILQLYDFIAVPDGPLMFCTALFLLAYKRFTETDGWGRALLMGLAMGLLAYSKYQGAFVVLFTAVSNVRLFKNLKFYAACLVALAVVTPHLWWQYEHDWVSFSYHLVERNRAFKFSYVTEFILNVFAVFNPFLFPVAAVAWWKTRAGSAVDRAMSAVTVWFILFFLASTARGHVQPQWYIPASFYIITLLYRYSGRSPRICRYVTRMGWITVALVALFRIEMMFNPLGIKYYIFDNEESYGQIAAIAQGRPVVFDGKYTAAAKYDFYAGGPGFAQPAIEYRTSQYGLMDMDSRWAGREVVVENREPFDGEVLLANGAMFRYSVVEDFRPSRLITVEAPAVPEELKPGERVGISVALDNPYPYAFLFGGGGIVSNGFGSGSGSGSGSGGLGGVLVGDSGGGSDGHAGNGGGGENIDSSGGDSGSVNGSNVGSADPDLTGIPAILNVVWRKGGKEVTVEPVVFEGLLQGRGKLGARVEFTVPSLPAGEYAFGFMVLNGMGNAWFNSAPQKVKIVE